jgi:hypothetical protein
MNHSKCLFVYREADALIGTLLLFFSPGELIRDEQRDFGDAERDFGDAGRVSRVKTAAFGTSVCR